MAITSELIHISVAAEWLGLSYFETKGLVERRKLAGVRIGRRTYIPTDAVVDYAIATADWLEAR